MPDISAIAGAVASLNAAVNITKAMKDLRDWSIVQSKVIELQSIILDAQGSLFAANEERATLIERVRQLEKQLANSEAGETEKQRYEMVDIGDGNVAYALKSGMRGSEPPHYACANCYSAGKISRLTHFDFPSLGKKVDCPSCKASMIIRKGWKPAS